MSDKRFFGEIKAGDYIKCTEAVGNWWTEGKLYDVIGLDGNGNAIVVDDDGCCMWPKYSSSSFEPVK